MKIPRFILPAALVAAIAAPAVAVGALGDLAFIPGAAGCWTDPSHGRTACTTGSTGLDGQHTVVVSPDGTSVYVGGGSGVNGRIAAFSRNAATGELTELSGTAKCVTADGSGGECTTDAALATVGGLAVSPDGTSVYAAVRDPSNGAIGGVVAYSRSASTGALTHVACANAGGTDGCADNAWLAGAKSVAVSPDGQNMYVGAFPSGLNGTVAAFSRTASTLAAVTGAGNACVSSVGTYGGSCTVVPQYQVWDPSSLAVTPDNAQVIAASGSGISILTRNPVTGALSSPASGPVCFATDVDAGLYGNPCNRAYGLYGNSSVALSPDGRSIYGASYRASADSGVGILDRNPTTGLISVPAGTGSCLTQSGWAFQWPGITNSQCGIGRYTAEAQGAVVSPDGRNLYVVNGGAYDPGNAPDVPAIDVFRRDTSTGAITQPGDPAGCLSQTGYAGSCLADSTRTNTVVGPTGIAISPDGATVYVADPAASTLLVLRRDLTPDPAPEPEPEPAAPTGGGTAAAPVTPATPVTPVTPVTPSSPRRLANAIRIRKGVGTTTGTVPKGATRITQAARTGGSAATQGFLEMARVKRATGRCKITAVRNKKTRRVVRRNYRCTIKLAKGTWTVTTTARGTAGVVAQGTRRVVVR